MSRRYWIFPVFILVVLIFTSGISLAATELVYRIPIRGEINPGMASFVNQGISEAEDDGADLIIFEIDTYGGLVDSGIKVRDSIFQAGPETVTYVASRAWSAGALIALAGEKMAILEGGSIGAAETRPNEEKYISALRKEFRATAEERGRDPLIAEAMVDSDISIEGVTREGKLVTLTAREAVTHNIANFSTKSWEGLLKELDLTGARVVEVKPTPLEKMAGIVTSPTVSGILLTVGFLALISEALMPGFGIGGTVGLLVLGVFFAGHMIYGLASWGLIVLFISGIILILLEILVIPGFGIAGIGGIAAILGSLYFLFPSSEIALAVLAGVMVFSILGAVIMIKYFGGSRFWENISLGESQSNERGYVSHQSLKDLVGSRGITITPLRPAGTAKIEEKRLDVVSEGGFIDRDQPVEVIEITGSRIVVRKIPEEDE